MSWERAVLFTSAESRQGTFNICLFDDLISLRLSVSGYNLVPRTLSLDWGWEKGSGNEVVSGYIVMIMGLFMFTYCVIKKDFFFLQRNLIIIALTFGRVTLCMFFLVKERVYRKAHLWTDEVHL